MPAHAALQSSHVRPRSNRRTTMPTCKVCASQMIAAESSVLGKDNVVSYLWSCDVCGYGFVTDASIGEAKENA